MTHRMLALPLVAVAIVGLSACTSQTSGTPGTTTTTSSAPTSSGGTTSGGVSLASVDPCSLLTQAQLSTNQIPPGETVPAAGGRACRWHRSDDGATIDGYNIQVVIYDQAGLDQLHTSGGPVSNYPVGKYQAELYQDQADDICIVSVGTSKTSRADISVTSSVSFDQGCKLVKEVAPKVVANFPAGS